LPKPLLQSCGSDQLDCDPNWTFTWTIRGITMARRSRPKLNTGDLPELRTHLIFRISVLAISDSLVWWSIAWRIAGYGDSSVDQRLTEIYDDPTFEEVQAVFLDWIERLYWVISNNGDYYIK
jgi:hypothetical protein